CTPLSAPTPPASLQTPLAPTIRREGTMAAHATRAAEIAAPTLIRPVARWIIGSISRGSLSAGTLKGQSAEVSPRFARSQRGPAGLNLQGTFRTQGKTDMATTAPESTGGGFRP